MEKEACEKELAASQAAAEKHADELKKVHEEADEKLKAAEEEKKQLVKHLKENPDAIDEKLRELGVSPFVMPFNKSDNYQKRFARWVNHKAIFKSTKWEDYNN